MKRKTRALLGLLLLLLLGAGAVLVSLRGAPRPVLKALAQTGLTPRIGGSPRMPDPVLRNDVPEVQVEVVARGLEVPWGLAFAPDGRLFVTERPGRIRVIRDRGAPETYVDLGGVVHEGEGGLLGIALHPRFPDPPLVYVMYTHQKTGGKRVNRVASFRDEGGRGTSERVLLDDIPAAQFHDGGALEFGPDGMLYIGTGDARDPDLAQDRSSLSGKVLRIAPDGSIPADNPFGRSPVWAYRFRNVSALSFQPGTNALFAANHGPSGEFPGLRNRDSVYVVQRGGNHGWPRVVGTSDDRDIVSPVLYWPEQAVPPGGASFYYGSNMRSFRGNYFLASLAAQHLSRIVFDGRRPARIEHWWRYRYGRLRAVEVGPDGAIYFTTSNRDGRNRRPPEGSDFIYRISARSQLR